MHVSSSSYDMNPPPHMTCILFLRFRSLSAAKHYRLLSKAWGLRCCASMCMYKMYPPPHMTCMYPPPQVLRFHRPSEREAVLCGGATLISRVVCLQQLPCMSNEEEEDACHMRRRILQQQPQQQVSSSSSSPGAGESASDRSMYGVEEEDTCHMRRRILQERSMYGVEALVRRTNGDLRALMMQVFLMCCKCVAIVLLMCC